MKYQTLLSYKFENLHRDLGAESVAHTVGYLELLWMWAHQAENGPIIGAEKIEKICRWPGEKGLLLKALIDNEWLDVVDENTVKIHNYEKHAPRYVKQREYQRSYRDRKTPPVSTCEHTLTNGEHTLAGVSPQPNQTKPNQTRSNP